MINQYWAKRQARIQENLLKRSQYEINKRLTKYYQTAARRVIADFESTYNKLLADQAEGKTPTTADLYKLDKYWAMQGNLRQELRKLGEKQVSLLTKYFEMSFFEIYYGLEIDGVEAFKTIDTEAARQLINAVWVADGKTWSQRVWNNINTLTDMLNDKLAEIVVTGKKTTDLKNALQERFGVSYHRADTLVRTELCHIQTESAKSRYDSYGIKYFEVLVDPDDRTCELCKKLIGKRFPVNGASPLPLHPNERCTLVPVIE